MGLLSNLLLLSCCLAFFRSKKCYSKSEKDAAKDAAYDAGYNAAYETAFDYGYDTGNNAKCSSEYEYEYEYHQDLHTGYECDRDSDCLESGRPKCLSGLCQEQSGGVLIIGGIVSGGVFSANVAKIGECPVNVNNIPQASVYGAAAVYDNLVYQCGGYTGSVNTNKCFIRSSSGQWTEGPSLHNIAQGLTLNKVGSTLVAIGGLSLGSYLNSVEILHPGSLTWQLQVYTISPARYLHCAVTISSTQVILAGGNYGSYLPNTEMLNLNTGSITRYAGLPLGQFGHACVLHQGRILLAGGYNSAGASSQAFTLDYSNQGNSWISASSMVTARYYFSMAVINGVPTAFGGSGAEGSMEKYEGGVWKSQVFTAPSSGHASVVIC